MASAILIGLEEAAMALAEASKAAGTAYDSGYFIGAIRNAMGSMGIAALPYAIRQVASEHSVDPARAIRAADRARAISSGVGAPGNLVPTGSVTSRESSGESTSETQPLIPRNEGIRQRFGRRPVSEPSNDFVDIDLTDQKDGESSAVTRPVRLPRPRRPNRTQIGLGAAAAATGVTVAASGPSENVRVPSDSGSSGSGSSGGGSSGGGSSGGDTNVPSGSGDTGSGSGDTGSGSTPVRYPLDIPIYPDSGRPMLSHGSSKLPGGLTGRYKIPLRGVYRPVEGERYSIAEMDRLLNMY